MMVHVGVSINRRMNLHIIQNKALTGCLYRVEILSPYIVVPSTTANEDNFVLVDNNFRPHRANAADDFLFEEGTNGMARVLLGHQSF